MVNKSEMRKKKKQKPAGQMFVSGINKWLKNNPPVISDKDITGHIDEIAYDY